jgi:hypothetical protein
MSGSITDPYNNSPPTDKDKNVLGLIFGESKCTNNTTTQILWYLAFAFIATIIFWLLATPAAAKYINNTGLKSLLFFIIIFLLYLLFNYLEKSYCK